MPKVGGGRKEGKEGRKGGRKGACLGCFPVQLLPFCLQHMEGGCTSASQPSSLVLQSVPVTLRFIIAQDMLTSTKGPKS